MNKPKTYLRPSTVIFSCLTAVALASLVGCADNDRQTSTTETSSTTMTPDSKDMTHRNH